ncbi:MAG: hypothetical protein EXR62_12840 [Chloroflexi bacterium]|nr:hypothetical protein [Chloroflexota bacterium]
MKKWGLILLVAASLLVISACSPGQMISRVTNNLAGDDVRLYTGPANNQLDNLIYVVKDDEVYAGKSSNNPTKVVLSREGDFIFNSRAHVNDTRQYKIVGNRILLFSETDPAKTLYSFGDTIYIGPQTNNVSAVAYTRRDNKIYKGNSNQLSDVVMSFDGDYNQLAPFLPILLDKQPQP